MERDRVLPWWLGGSLLAGVLLVSIALVGPLGVSTQYVRAVGFACEAVSPGIGQRNPYFAEEKLVFGWSEWVVIGIPLGAALVALLRRRPRGAGTEAAAAPLPRILGRRWIAALFGGALVLFGARLAGGCTSGHILSGVSQLAVSSLLFMAGVFASGVLTARVLMPKPGSLPSTEGMR